MTKIGDRAVIANAPPKTEQRTKKERKYAHKETTAFHSADLDLSKSAPQISDDIEDIALEHYEEQSKNESPYAKPNTELVSDDVGVEFVSKNPRTDELTLLGDLSDTVEKNEAVQFTSADRYSKSANVDHLDLSEITLADSITDTERLTELAGSDLSLENVISEIDRSSKDDGNIGQSLVQELARVKRELASLAEIINQRSGKIETDGNIDRQPSGRAYKAQSPESVDDIAVIDESIEEIDTVMEVDEEVADEAQPHAEQPLEAFDLPDEEVEMTDEAPLATEVDDEIAAIADEIEDDIVAIDEPIEEIDEEIAAVEEHVEEVDKTESQRRGRGG